MSDEKDLTSILSKLDSISIDFNKIAENFILELTKMKEILNYSKKDTFLPKKFFNDFLKPQLGEKKKITKKEMLKLCEKRGKYDSYNTLHSYLYKLEINGYIQSEKINNEKHYMLT